AVKASGAWGLHQGKRLERADRVKSAPHAMSAARSARSATALERSATTQEDGCGGHGDPGEQDDLTMAIDLEAAWPALLTTFGFGACIGSLLNDCIHSQTAEESLLR